MGIILSQFEHLWPIVYQRCLKVATAFVAVLLLLKNWIGSSQIGQLAFGRDRETEKKCFTSADI